MLREQNPAFSVDSMGYIGHGARSSNDSVEQPLLPLSWPVLFSLHLVPLSLIPLTQSL